MELLKFIFLLISVALLLISGTIILRKAFQLNIWLGFGCIIFPITALFFILKKWKETKYEFLFFLIGAFLFAGIYFISRHEMDLAVAHIRILNISLTTSLDTYHTPVSCLTSISVNEQKAIMHLNMRIPPGKKYRFTGKYFNPNRRMVYNYTFSMIPTQKHWYVWFERPFNKSADITGNWKFLFLVNDKLLAVKQFAVNPDSISVNR